MNETEANRACELSCRRHREFQLEFQFEEPPSLPVFPPPRRPLGFQPRTGHNPGASAAARRSLPAGAFSGGTRCETRGRRAATTVGLRRTVINMSSLSNKHQFPGSSRAVAECSNELPARFKGAGKFQPSPPPA